MTTTPFRLGYRPELDGLRGLSIIAVMLSHLIITANGERLRVPGGWIGVDVFFVLSGFLITSLLVQEWRTTGAISLASFYRRRALRLVPALIAIVAVLAAASVVLSVATGRTESAGRQLQHDLPISLSYVANWFNALRGNPTPSMGHMWSLAIEEQFYLVWPLLLVVLLRRGASVRHLLWLAMAGISIVTSLRVVMTGYVGWNRIHFGTDTRADALLIGCVLALVLARGAVPVPAAVLCFGGWLAGALLIALVAFGSDPAVHAPHPLLYSLTALAAALVILALVAGDWTQARHALGWRPLASLGRVSYGVYLWHWPLFWLAHDNLDSSVVAQVLALAATAVGATGSWVLIEQPCLRLKARTPQAAGVSLPVATPTMTESAD